MKNNLSAKSSKLSVIFLVGFLMILTVPGKSQNIQTSLGETKWQTSPYKTVIEENASTLTIVFTYIFDSKGKVLLVTSFDESAGMTNEFLAGTSSYDPQIHDQSERRLVRTPPKYTTKEIFGIYKINGKSVFMDFPEYTIEATIQDDIMKGVTTYKTVNKKYSLEIKKVSSENTLNANISTPKVNEDSIANCKTGFGDVVKYALETTYKGVFFISADHKLCLTEGYKWVFPTKEADESFIPDNGYRWINPKDQEDFRVERVP